MSDNIEEKYKMLDIYINQLRQSVAVIIEDTDEHNKYLNYFRTNLTKQQQIIYIDFKKIHNARDLSEQLLEQYIKLFDSNMDIILDEDDYRSVDYILEFITKVEETEENIVIWMDNFTDILLLDEDWLFGLLRGVFQHHEHIVHVFTSSSKDRVNQIFYNINNPFFRFARIIQ